MATAVIDTDFDSYAINTGGVYTESETSTTVFGGIASTNIRRAQFRFPLSGIAAGSTVSNSTVQFDTDNILDVANGTADILSYGTGGDDDPDVDSATDKYNKSASGTTYLSATSAFGALGSTGELDLGATADSHIEGNISSPARFSLAVKRTTESGTNDRAEIQALEHADTDPATLTVTYTAAATSKGAIRNINQAVTRASLR